MSYFEPYNKDDEDEDDSWAEDEDEDGPLTDEDAVYQKIKKEEEDSKNENAA